MAGNLNLRRQVDPDPRKGRTIFEHIASGDVCAWSPIDAWHQDGRNYVTLALHDPGMKFRILRDEIAPRDLIERLDGADDPPPSLYGV